MESNDVLIHELSKYFAQLEAGYSPAEFEVFKLLCLIVNNLHERVKELEAAHEKQG